MKLVQHLQVLETKCARMVDTREMDRVIASRALAACPSCPRPGKSTGPARRRWLPSLPHTWTSSAVGSAWGT